MTEFWWFSNPPRQSPRAVPLLKQARNIEEALYLYWKAGARVAIYLFLRDDPIVQTGLFFSDGQEKPALRAFSFPFVTERRSRKQVSAWGKAPSDGKLSIQVRKRTHWRTLKRVRVGAGKVFKTRLKLRGAAELRASVDGERSLVWSERR